MGVLPQLDMACSWLPVDTVAASVLQIAGLATGAVSSTNGLRETSPRLVHNIVSSCTFSWTSDLRPPPRSLIRWPIFQASLPRDVDAPAAPILFYAI